MPRSLLLSILATLVTCLSAHTRPNAGAAPAAAAAATATATAAPSPSDSPSDLDWEAMAPLLHSSGAVAQFGERALQETFRRLARDIPPPALLPQHARSSTDNSSNRATTPPAPAAVWQLPVRRARAGWWFLLDPLARSLAADIARSDRGVAIADGVLGEALAREAHGSAERMWARSSPDEDEDGRGSGGGSGGGSDVLV